MRCCQRLLQVSVSGNKKGPQRPPCTPPEFGMASATPGGAPGYDYDKEFGNNITHLKALTYQRLRRYTARSREVKGRTPITRFSQLSGVPWCSASANFILAGMRLMTWVSFRTVRRTRPQVRELRTGNLDPGFASRPGMTPASHPLTRFRRHPFELRKLVPEPGELALGVVPAYRRWLLLRPPRRGLISPRKWAGSAPRHAVGAASRAAVGSRHARGRAPSTSSKRPVRPASHRTARRSARAWLIPLRREEHGDEAFSSEASSRRQAFAVAMDGQRAAAPSPRAPPAPAATRGAVATGCSRPAGARVAFDAAPVRQCGGLDAPRCSRRTRTASRTASGGSGGTAAQATRSAP